MTTLTTLLVGMHFRPPAKVLVANLPSGTTLHLQAEPENPYDEGAIKVILLSEDLPQDGEVAASLDTDLSGMGYTLEDIKAEPAWHLGYVAASDGKPLQGTDYVGNKEVAPLMAQGTTTCTFGVDGAGKPILFLEEPPAQLSKDDTAED